MTISVTRSAAYTTSDGTSHATRELALAHEKFLQRKSNLSGIKFASDKIDTSDGIGDGFIAVNDLPELIAQHADLVVAALTVKQARKAPAPKAPADKVPA